MVLDQAKSDKKSRLHSTDPMEGAGIS